MSHLSDASLIELLEKRDEIKSRDDFLTFRITINRKRIKGRIVGGLLVGAWVIMTCRRLEEFERQIMRGERPILCIEAPPQHGKSTCVIDFIAWFCGRHPEFAKVIYASFSKRLSIRANLALQRIFDKPKYKAIFPGVMINEKNVVTRSSQRLRNKEIIGISEEGYFRNTTVGGAITGETLNLGVIDDPIKGRSEANSITIRDKVFDWLIDDFMSRRAEYCGVLIPMTRWHVDDPVGRLKKLYPHMQGLTFKAIAEEDEVFRNAGEALFPELKSLQFLLETKEMMRDRPSEWEALYQQNPVIRGGNLIKTDNFKRYNLTPFFKYRIIFADTAMKTKERNDYSVFQCWGLGEDGHIYLIDQIRGKWTAPNLKKMAVDFWNKHKAEDVHKNGALRGMHVEDKASGTGLIQELVSKIPVTPIQRHIDKFTRACDILDYIETGRVYIPAEAPWISDFITECETFDGSGKSNDDQIDPMIDAINEMIGENNIVSLWEKSR